MTRLYVLLFSLLLGTSVYGQAEADKNALDAKLREVYGTNFFNSKPELKQQFVRLLNERVRYVQELYSPDEKYPSVQAQGLQNKQNSSLQAHTIFDEQQFNPLIYKLDFFSKQTQVYRIDNSDYLLVIDPL